jgi:RHS repeat-associated protein
LAAAAPTAPARAQGESRLINTPAESFVMAPGGVDMRTGRYVYSETDLSIGGEGGLALTRTMTQNIPGHGNPFGNLSHNWDITISELRIQYDNPQLSGNDFRIFVNFGGRSQTFKSYSYSTGFGQESLGPLATLTYTGDRAGAAVVYTYQAPDGSVAVFRPLGSAGNGDCSADRRCAYISQLTEADGTVLTFDYTASGSWNGIGGTARLQRVTSSRGYALVFEGTENRITKACVFNLALGAASSNCASGALASATYSYTMVNGFPVVNYRLVGATGPDNATSSFTYGSGTDTMGFVRPGETDPWQTLTIGQRADEQDVMQDVVGQQSFADGLSYTYSYGAAPITNNSPNPTIAGGSYTYNDGQSRTVSMPYAWPLLHHAGNPGSSCYPNFCPLDQPDGYLNYVYQQTPGPVTITDPLGRTTTLDYCDPIPMQQLPANESNRCVVVPLVSFTDPEGARTELQYDDHRNITRVTRHARPGSVQPNGQPWPDIVTSAVFDTQHPKSSSKPLSMTDARGNVTEFTYAPEHGGLLTTTAPAPTAGAPRPQTRHVYTLRQARYYQDGTLVAGPGIWLRTSTSTCRTSAATSNAASPCAVAGDEVRTDYDYGPDSGPTTLLLRGQAVTSTDNGVTTVLRSCYAYDASGRKISETGPGANLASCPAGPPATALPFTGSTRYDAAGRVTGTISADPDLILGPGGSNGPLPHRAVRSSYDAAGRLIRVETGTLPAWQSEAVAPAAWANFTVYQTLETNYDAMGRKTRDMVREGAAGTVRTVAQYSYDVLGRLQCTAVRMNPALFGSLPTSACTPAIPAGGDGPDRIARSLYDAAGQRLQVREGVGTADEGTEATWAYNLNGQVTAVIDGNGNRAELRYDGHGRQSCWLFPSPTRPSAFDDSTPALALSSAGAVNGNCESQGDFESYTYDPNGNRTALRKRDGTTIGYSYDNLNRLTGRDLPAGAWYNLDRSFAYDNLGRMISAGGNGTIAMSWDGFGRLTAETGPFGTVGYQYDAAGRRTRLTWPGGFYVAYDYLDTGELAHVRENNAASGAGVLATYSYDGLGRRTRIDGGNGAATTYDYDGLSRLAGLAHAFTGGAGNVAWSYEHNSANGLRSAARDNNDYAWAGHYAVSRAYITNGRNQYTAAGAAGFGYDLNGNLTSDGTRGFEYNAENRLTVGYIGAAHQELIDDARDRLFRYYDGTANRWMLYDGTDLIAEVDGNGTTLRRYVHGPGEDDPLVWYEGAGTNDRHWLHADAQGSIVALSDASGALTAINRYDEYGIPAAANSGRFQYTGQIWLPELGMYFYKSRVYSPTLGRFLQVDPVGYADQFNLYAYVGDDPVNRTDPTGLQSCPKREHCPDVLLPPELPRREAAAAVGPARRAGGEERGANTYRNIRTGERRLETGSSAGRPIDRSGHREFEHRLRWNPGVETPEMTTHLHNGSELTGANPSRIAETAGNNFPSIDDQRSMNQTGAAVQIVAPDATMTLYRIGDQDHVRVDSGDRSQLPDHNSQDIIVDPED